MRERPRLLTIGEEMRRWCALLREELSSWPHVRSRPMFGLVGFYRGQRIFAAVPLTRAADTATSIMLKLPGVRSARLRRGGPGAACVTFEMASDSDVAEALRWLGRAYKMAATGRRR